MQLWQALIAQKCRPVFSALQWLVLLQQSMGRIVEFQPHSALALVFGIQKHRPCSRDETDETTTHSFSKSGFVIFRHEGYQSICHQNQEFSLFRWQLPDTQHH